LSFLSHLQYTAHYSGILSPFMNLVSFVMLSVGSAILIVDISLVILIAKVVKHLVHQAEVLFTTSCLQQQ
jgi:hypothetical protein